MKTIFSMLLVFLMVSLSSCKKTELSDNNKKMIDLDAKSAQLVEGDNAFGLKAFQKIRELSDKENIMVSPLSISVALAMAYNGADGKTKTEMEDVLNLSGLSVDEINASYKMLISALQSLDDKVVFEIANAIFYKEGFSAKPDFLNINRQNYDAKVESLDFSSQSAVDEINNWVALKTRDKIKSILEKLNPDDRMVLLNAIYFNGIWAKKFDAQGTHNLPFFKSDGSSIEVATMNKEEKLGYQTNSLFSAVKMPYGNGQYNMLVLLPTGTKNSQEIINNLTASNWKTWIKDFETKDKVVVTMPRFKFDFEMGLKEVLTEMGMKDAFSPSSANFSKISDEFLYISSVRHKSFIDVNENGTEAAAVTSITFTTTSAGPNVEEKIYFTVNKPFVFAITEKDTDAILFIGEVNHPEYN